MIGIFDSGSGGLTVLKALRDELPSADVIYFGDIRYAPYGQRSREELSTLTVSALRFLQEKGADKIISACNSVSTTIAISLYDLFPIAMGDLIEMVGPTVSYFKDTKLRVVVAATLATIQSGMYQEAFRMVGTSALPVAIPDLAGAIEFGQPEDTMRHMIREAFASVDFSQYDVLVLGCTHYPLVKHLFEGIVPKNIVVFDPAIAVAERAKKQYWPQEVGNGTTRYFISRDSTHFRQKVERLFPKGTSEITVVYEYDALKGV